MPSSSYDCTAAYQAKNDRREFLIESARASKKLQERCWSAEEVEESLWLVTANPIEVIQADPMSIMFFNIENLEQQNSLVYEKV